MSAYVYLGNAAGAKGRIDIEGGALNAGSITLGNAAGATGTVVQTGGNVTLSGGLTMTQAAGGSRYSMSGDTTSVNAPAWPGLALAHGNVFEQDGGTSTVRFVEFQNSPVAAPTVRLKKGTMNITYADGIKHTQADSRCIFEMGSNGIAVINETAAGTLLTAGGYSGGSVSPRIFRGCGAVRFTGQLQNYGQVVADGWDGAEERDLDLTSFTSVTNDNGTSPVRGWWAVNKARLRLPAIAVASGNNAYSWGEPDSDATPDAVNSMRLIFSNAAAGTLDIALLAPGRAELGATTGSIIGLWQLSPSGSLAFDSLSMAIRYDNAAAAGLGLTESALKLFKTVGNSWVDVSTLPGVTVTVNTTTKILTASGLSSCSYFAVGTGVSGEMGVMSMGMAVSGEPAPERPKGVLIVVQ
ncbi:MAG: hypothetical protein R6X19_04495 [Kiritimatiellia bacterium]